MFFRRRPKPCPKHLLLTTFPQHRSANVGDALIASAFVAMARSLKLVDEVEHKFRGDALSDEALKLYASRPIFMPGMSVSNDLYPKLYVLRQHFDEIPRSLVPFGCTWQHPIGLPEHFERAVIDGETLRLLQMISDTTGPIAVRDHSAELVLTRNDIPAVTVGDCAWYHLPSRGKPMRTPSEVHRIAVTTPHHVPLTQQSMDVLSMVREVFPGATIDLVIHSRTTAHVKLIIAAAEEMGLSVVNAAGDLSIFDRYDEYDLHVGHRLHGHIGFLRRRIPSVLFMEDARSRGFSSSIPTGCFPGFRKTTSADISMVATVEEAAHVMEPDPDAVSRVRDFLRQEARDGFTRFAGIPTFLDQMLDKVALPQLKNKYQLAIASGASL